MQLVGVCVVLFLFWFLKRSSAKGYKYKDHIWNGS